jgi:hypothetical protein
VALGRLKGSNAESARAAAITKGPAEPAGRSEAQARRWLAVVGTAADDLIAMQVLRHGAEPEWASAIKAVRERGDPITRTQLAIDGRDLQALGAGGPRVGEILAALLDRVLDEPSLNTRDQLLSLAREMV